MKDPVNIITEQDHDFSTGSWGSYNKTTKQWDPEIPVATGKQVREWIQSQLSSIGERLDKVEESSILSISAIGDTTINIQEGETIVLNFTVGGKPIISKGLIYQVVGNSEVFLSEFTNIGKGSNSVVVSSPKTSGIYKYRIKITDTAGFYAKTQDELEYLEYEVKYGGISILYNITNINAVPIKNVYSIAEKYIICDISVRDDSYNVTGVYISDHENINIPLSPRKTIQELNNTYIGYNYYILPNVSELQPLDGKFCYIKITYTEDQEEQSVYKELFTILKADSLEFVPQSTEKDYYLGFADYYTFKLESGVSNLSIYVTQDEDSDFVFEPVTISAYNNFSLRVIPNEVKQNAFLNLLCRFNIGNEEKIIHFSKPIGNIKPLPEKAYYEPAQGSISLDKVIEAGDGDLVDGIQYYKVVDDFVTEEYNTHAFIVDLYCRINQINDKSLKYVRILQGNTEIGYVTEDVINCRGIITDTPLNEWVQIGIGYNIEESVNRNNEDIPAEYHAIYINGMIVKNATIDETSTPPLSSGNPITIELSDGINVQKCFIYYKNNGQDTISPAADMYSIEYTNYLSHNPQFEEPEDLPILKLKRITDAADRNLYFNLIKQHNEDLAHLTTFGTIGLLKAGTMAAYDSGYGNNTVDHDNATLFRQDVNIKKPALKAYCVLCEGSYIVNGINLLQGCIVEVHTQGTSTLRYSVPNFKLTFWKLLENDVERFYPEFIKKGDGTFYKESVYTAKADSMDSSHLNNTPTCNFFNNLVQSLISNEEFPDFVGSPSALEGNLDAIMGFPIVLEISDNASSMEDVFINIGSFMLNIDKTGDSLGFDDNTISLEGTSNDNESGASGRFVLDPRLSYFETEADIDAAYLLVSSAITDKSITEDLLAIDRLVDYPYAQWCLFFSEGLEYRYPDSDMIKTKSGKLSKVMKLSDFKKLYRMWEWVSKSDEYDMEKYQNEFENYFDLNYCMLYFIQLMVFGQTDNLGKNAMFDTWDGEHWYPRPYDLDSEAGLDNNGNDNIAPFVEIKPEFSLNYNPLYTQEQLAENYLLQTSKILYGAQELERYHYSSNSSKLWINFYKNYKDRICGFYLDLRRKAGYTPDAIIQLCESSLINKLGILQYNKDFQNKYLATIDQKLAYGNRWFKFKKWMRQRFSFCDSYFGASDIGNYDLVSAITYALQVESPQYVTQIYQDDSTVKFVTDRVQFSAGSSSATKMSLSVNQELVLDTNLFKYVSYGSGARKYTSIINLDVSGNTQIPTIESLVGTNLPNLKELNISNSSVTTLNNIPMQMKKLTAQNVTLTSIVFIEDSLIEEIDLTGSTITGNVSFSRLHNLKKLNLTNCEIQGNITLANLDNLQTFIIDGASFNGNVIIQDGVNITELDFSNLSVNNIVFDGNEINITKLNFCNTKFGQSSINLNPICSKIEEMYFNGCENLKYLEITDGSKFTNLETFSIYDSPIEALGANSEIFDAQHFNNISQLQRITYSASGTVTYSPFTFANSKVVNILNLSWNGTGRDLFRYCIYLEEVHGTLNLTTSISYLFYRCYNLSILPTINIDSSVISADYAMCQNSSLTYQQIESIIHKCTHANSFDHICCGVQFAANTVINLQTLFGSNVAENVVLTHAFSYGGYSTGIPTVTNTFIINGKIPSNVKTANYMFAHASSISIPYDLLLEATGLQNTVGMFAGCSILFVGSQSSPLPVYEEVRNQGQENEETVQITLTNAIDASFLPTNLVNISSMFCNTNVQTIDTTLFANLTNLEECSSCFANSGSNIKTFSKDLIVNTLWSNNSKLKNISGCFFNVKNVYCEGQLIFHNSVTSINMSGLFGLGTFLESSLLISLQLNNISPTITTDSNFAIDSGSAVGGVFQNRKVYISDSTNVLRKLQNRNKNAFYGARLYVPDGVTQFDLTYVTDCEQMFRNCELHTYNLDLSIADQSYKFVSVLLPTSCRSYIRMFEGSKILDSLPQLRSSLCENVSYMFSNCVINSTSVIIPYDYFLICKNNIQNVSYMFFRNIYITELQYDSTIGLFQDCNKLNSIDSIFYGAHYLHKGIPHNIFGTTAIPGLVSLKNMFRESAILHGVEDYSTSGLEKWIDSNTFSPLTRLQSIEGMFLENRPVSLPQDYTFRAVVKNADNNDIYVINPSTFASINNLQSIRYLFKNSSNITTNELLFLKFNYGEEAFYDCSITKISSQFVQDMYISEVRNVARMFCQFTPKYIENVGTFISKLDAGSNANKANIAYNLTNDDIPSNLKDPISGQSYTGFYVDSGHKTIYN